MILHRVLSRVRVFSLQPLEVGRGHSDSASGLVSAAAYVHSFIHVDVASSLASMAGDVG